MRLIIDSNILISGLIKDSITREILFNDKIEFYLPEYVLNEVNKYFSVIGSKADLTREDLEILIDLILENLNIVPVDDYKHKMKEANEIIGSIDEKDVQFIALALSIKNDGIWTNDKHFKKQNKIKIYTTEEIIALL